MIKSMCVRGTFSCHFELRNFPYDQQTIYVHGVCYSASAELSSVDPANRPDTAARTLMRIRGSESGHSSTQSQLPARRVTKCGSRAKVAQEVNVDRVGGAVRFHAWEGASVVKTTVSCCIPSMVSYLTTGHAEFLSARHVVLVSYHGCTDRRD